MLFSYHGNSIVMKHGHHGYSKIYVHHEMSEKKNQLVEPICNIVFFKIKGKIYLVGESCKCQYHIIPKKG